MRLPLGAQSAAIGVPVTGSLRVAPVRRFTTPSVGEVARLVGLFTNSSRRPSGENSSFPAGNVGMPVRVRGSLPSGLISRIESYLRPRYAMTRPSGDQTGRDPSRSRVVPPSRSAVHTKTRSVSPSDPNGRAASKAIRRPWGAHAGRRTLCHGAGNAMNCCGELPSTRAVQISRPYGRENASHPPSLDQAGSAPGVSSSRWFAVPSGRTVKSSCSTLSGVAHAP